MSSNTSIIVCGQKFDIGTKVVLWDELKGFNGYDTATYTYNEENRRTGKIKKITVSGARYSKRSLLSPTLERVQKVVNQFFLHHSGLYRSRDTFNVLHRQRRLSVHLILDDDGTIYQTLDLKDKAWHGGKNNPQSVGIEIDSRAHASRFTTAYDKPHQKKYGVGPREKRMDYINGKWIKGYQYSDIQYRALISLAMGLQSIFPNMKTPSSLYSVDFPRVSGRICTSAIKKPLAHKGLIGHYNTNSGKNDPISFDHYRLLRGMKLCDPRFGSTFLTANTWLDRQEWLNAIGYDPGTIDGKNGIQTKIAVMKFQTDNGLLADGIWGPKTNHMLDLATKERGIR